MSEVDLSRFRQGSEARRVAERLLTGRRMTRGQLANGSALATVNRVIQILEEQGVKVSRDVDGREATFQVVAFEDPKGKVRIPSLDEEVTLVRDELLAGEHAIDFVTSTGARFRGVYPGMSSVPPVGTKAVVTGVARDGQEASVVLDTGKKRVRVESVQLVGV